MAEIIRGMAKLVIYQSPNNFVSRAMDLLSIY
jgi:hypothetical protein